MAASHAVVLARALFLTVAVGIAYEPPAKFIIVSNGQTGLISYGRVPTAGGNISEIRTLIEANSGLQHPQGITVDQKRKLLLIADSGIRKIVSYGLSLNGDTLQVDDQTTVAENVEARWVAVDGMGNVFFSDESNNKLFMVTAQDVTDGNMNSTQIFLDDASGVISGPGGLAADNFYLYWTNKVGGKQAGSVVRAPAPMAAYPSPPAPQAADPGILPSAAAPPTPRPTIQILAQQRAARQLQAAGPSFEVLEKNVDKSYGLCLTLGQMCYTDAEKSVWCSNTTSGSSVAVTSKLISPRGCVWDGLSLMYVADRSAGGVFALPAPMHELKEVDAIKVADVEEAFGIAIFSAASPLGASRAVLAFVLVFLVSALDVTERGKKDQLCEL